MARKRTWIVENTWTCSSCGEKNRGRDMECKACGSPKEKHEKYDTSGNLTAPAVTDPDLLKKAKAGANWQCKFCLYDNRDLVDECESCGAGRYDTEEEEHPPVVKFTSKASLRPDVVEALDRGVMTNEQMEELLRATGADAAVAKVVPDRKFKGGSYREPPEVEEVEPAPEPDRFEEAEALHARMHWEHRKAQLKKATPWIAGALAIAAVVGALVWTFMPHEIEVDVADTSWTHTRLLQQRRQNHGSGWDETVPAGAFDQSCSRRFRTTERCNPHDCNCRQVTDYCSRQCNCRTVAPTCRTTCSDNGNGFSTCSESCSGGGTTCDTCREPCGSHEECSTCWDECDVYDQWCEYEYYDWPTIDREVTRGHGPQTHWGERLVVDESRHQRIRQEAAYVVTFTDGEERWTIHPETLAAFRRYERGERWLIEVNHAGQVWPEHEVRDGD